VVPLFVGGGLSCQGLIPGRNEDLVSLGVIRGAFSRYLPQTAAETVLEANYQIRVTGGVTVTPDLQYVIRPGGSSALGNAVVLGSQLQVTF
jgi:porin